MERASDFLNAIRLWVSSIWMQTGPPKGSFFLSVTKEPGINPNS